MIAQLHSGCQSKKGNIPAGPPRILGNSLFYKWSTIALAEKLQYFPFPDGRPGTAAVSDGRTVYVSQLTAPCDCSPADLRTQTRQILTVLETILHRADACPQSILQLTVTIADSRCIPAVLQVWREWCAPPIPSPVGRFGRLPGTLVAVDAVAAIEHPAGERDALNG